MAEKKDIETLLDNHIKNQLSPDEAHRLKELIDTTDDEVLDTCLSKSWNSYSGLALKQNKVRKQVLVNLNAMVSPRPFLKRQLILWRSVAAILIGLLVACGTYLYIDKANLAREAESFYLVQVGKGEKATILLPDGTKVHLNALSSLSYPTLFGRGNREVELTGEAFFEVTHNREKPFIVHTSSLSVKVLGTTFNVYAPEAGDYCETTLVEGRVEILLNTVNPQSRILKPKQKLHYNKQTGKCIVSDTDLWEEMAWRRGDLVLHSQTFSDIMVQLETYYGITFQVEGDMPAKLFSGSFHDEDVTDVLLNLQQHYPFTFRKVGTVVYIKFK